MQQYGTFTRPRRRTQLNNKIIWLSRIAKFSFFALILCIILGIGLVIWYSRDLPAPGKLSSAETYGSTKILDKNGKELYSIYKNYQRVYVPLSDIPKTLQNATVVAEDKTFYTNQGFSIFGYLRAIRDIILYHQLSGGSTITQELVKNVLLTPERSIDRKIKELILSIQVNRLYSKNQILEMYMNDVGYGGTAVGVQAASKLYFGKDVKDLDLAESAFLAGLPQAPTYYSPYTGSNKAYVGRTQYVLDQLEQNGYISKKQSDAALKEITNMKFSEEQGSILAPHFVMYVRQQLINMFGETLTDQGSLTVKTTLDYDIEQHVEKILSSELDNLTAYHVGNGAVVVMDPKTGAILAMDGSKDYFDVKNDGNFNAALAFRQPGSSLKPVMYATAFEKGYTPATLIMDTKTDFYTGNPVDKPYTPVNYDGKFRGPVQIRFALGNSLNIPAVKMLARVGIKPVMQKAYDMGITNWEPTQQNLKEVGLSLVLGGREATLLQEVTAYSVFADRGVRKDPYAISEVLDAHGNVIYKHEDVPGKQVLSPEVAFLISHILLDNNAREAEFGPNSWLVVPGHTVSVKTGTTDEKRDNWTIGYTPSFTVGVWVGNNDNSPMNQKIASGITGASPVWNKVMSFILKGKKDEQFAVPPDVIAMQIDSYSGGLPVSGKPERSEYFIKGTEPTTISPIYQTLKISKHQTDKLANQDEVNHGDYDTKQYIIFTESDPVSQDGKNRWQEGIDNWVHATYSAANPEYYPPTQTTDYKYSESPSATPTPVPQSTATPTPTNQTPTPSFTPTPTPTP